MTIYFLQPVEVILGVAYLFVLCIIITSKRRIFYNAFYIVFVSTGIADILAVCVTIFFQLNGQLGFGPEVQGIVSFCVTLSGLTFAAHMVGNMIIALNRYSALCLFNKYDKIWRRKNVWIFVGLQYAVASIVVSPLIGVQIEYTQNVDGTYSFAGIGKQADLINKFIGFGICVTYALVSVVVNIRLAIEWHKLLRLGDSSRYSRQEKALLLYALLVFCSSILVCAWQFLEVFATYTKNKILEAWVWMQWFWINDVMIVIPPFFMLLLSAELRQEIVDIIRCRSRSSDDVAMIPTRTNHPYAAGKDSSSHFGRLTNVVSAC